MACVFEVGTQYLICGAFKMRSRLATVTLLPILDSGGGGVGVPKERRGDTVQVEYSTLETHNIEMIGCASP